MNLKSGQSPVPQSPTRSLPRDDLYLSCSIYFTEEAKNQLYLGFNRSLRDGGYFLAGGTEPILYYRQFGFDNVGLSYYRKIGPPQLETEDSLRSLL